jgi:serine/threonine-protein kinase RsbW
MVRSSSDILTLLESVARAMTEQGFLDRDAFAMRLALEEAVVNGIKHGNKYDPEKVVRVRARILDDQVLVEVEDEGPGFDPDQVADPLAPENLERSCGRGLLLMRHYMTWVKYDGRGNRVTLCKSKSSR